MRFPAATALLLGAGLVTASAEPLPVGATTYVEQSLDRSGLLTVEHPPTPRDPRGHGHARREGSAAIAGFCREGGTIRRRDASGNPILLRQRESCDSVAPRTLRPGRVDPRPVWPAERVARGRVLRAKG